MDAAQNKSVFKSERVKVDDGKGNLTEVYATLTPSGLMKGSPITDKATGEALKIPTEGDKELTDKAKNKYYAGLWGVTEAEAAKILKSKLADTPTQAWSKIVDANSKKDFMGKQPKQEEILASSINQWIMGRQGQPFPVNIVDTINESSIPEKNKEGLLAIVGRYNQSISGLNQSATAQTEPQLQPETPIPASLPPQAIPKAITQPKPQAPAPAPAQPAPTPKRPLTPEAINTAFNAIQQGADTTEVQAKLTEAGFDLSPESVGLMAIDAVNTGGVPSDVVQKYLAAIGIQWDTPKG